MDLSGRVATAERDITTLNEGLTVSTVNMQGGIYAEYNQHEVTVLFCGGIGISVPNGATTTIARLPSGVPKPRRSVYGQCMVSGNNPAANMLVTINRNGDIQFYNYTGGSIDYAYGEIVYFA